MTKAINNIGAYILAGGNSSRMGEDKGLKLIHGEPMVYYVIACLKQVFNEITIISHNEAYKQLGVRVIEDLIKDKGPMGGLYTGLMDSKFPLNFFVSCDMPFISVPALHYMVENAVAEKITVPLNKGKVQPLPGIYPKTLQASLKEKLIHNQLKMMTLAAEFPSRIIGMEKAGLDAEMLFCNVNSISELAAASEKLKP